MRFVLTFAAVSLMALSAPAFAQSTGAPGAAPAGSGSNTPGSGVGPNKAHTDMKGTTGGMTNNGDGMSEGRAAAPNAPNAAGIDQESIAPGNATGGGGTGAAGGNGAGGTGNGGAAK